MSATAVRSPQVELAYLISGEDPALVGQTLSTLLERLAGVEDVGAAALEEYTIATREDTSALALALDACRTPPFLSPRRVVVIRDGEGLSSSEIHELVSYLEEPLESTTLVLAIAGRSVPAALMKAMRNRGTHLLAEPATNARARTEWFGDRIRAAPLRIDSASAQLLREHLGEDLARLEGLLATLESAYGTNASITNAELEPFLGEAGSVAPWDLTDAVDTGEGAAALEALHRLVEAGERHPLQILAVLHRHYGAMLAVDGADVLDDNAASQLTGLRPFPARKALNQARRLGHERIARAVGLLAVADLDLRGKSGLTSELVLEILVARLAQNSRRPTAHGTTRRAPARRGR